MLDPDFLDNNTDSAASCGTTLVIFGACGDLARRKLFPALFNLEAEGLLPEGLSIIAFARREYSTDGYTASLKSDCAKFLAERSGERPFSDGIWNDLAKRISYHHGDFSDPNAFLTLHDRYFKEGPRNGLFYLACAPASFSSVAGNLAAAGLGSAGRSFLDTGPYRRLVVEKPFGYDLESARALNKDLAYSFDDGDIFRVDHYLGKEAVQNLLLFRFAHSVFESAWNRRFIERVEIRVLETGSIANRGGYYDRAGAARDMLQNHLMQLFCMVAMEVPASLSAAHVREQKVRALRCVRAYEPEECHERSVRGQYGPGILSDGSESPGYLGERHVPPDSRSETFAAIKLDIDNWRWSGVPFILSSGKAMKERRAEIIIRFRQAAEPPFSPMLGQALMGSDLRIDLRPESGICISFDPPGAAAKNPAQAVRDAFSFIVPSRTDRRPDAHERLLSDALSGDPTLFIRFDEAAEAWRILDVFERAWKLPESRLVVYAAGSEGPCIDASGSDAP